MFVRIYKSSVEQDNVNIKNTLTECMVIAIDFIIVLYRCFLSKTIHVPNV